MTISADPHRGTLGEGLGSGLFKPFVKLYCASANIGMRRARHFQVALLLENDTAILNLSQRPCRVCGKSSRLSICTARPAEPHRFLRHAAPTSRIPNCS